MEDSVIVSRMLLRDEQALRETEIKYKKLMFFVAHNILGSVQDSEECVNDALLDIWNSIPPQKPESMETYAVMIVRRRAFDKLDYYNAQKRAFDTVSFDGLENIAESQPEVAENQLSDLISGFLSTLKSTDRKIFMQRYYLCMPIEKICKSLGMKSGTVLSKLARTREKLKIFLTDKGVKL